MYYQKSEVRSLLNNHVLMEMKNLTLPNTSGGGVFSGTLNIAKSGYTAIGVVGWGTGQSHFYPADLYISGSILTYRFKNNDTAAHSGTCKIYVLYFKVV